MGALPEDSRSPILARVRSSPRWGWLLSILLVGAAVDVLVWTAVNPPLTAGGKRCHRCVSSRARLSRCMEVVLAFDRPGVLGKVAIQEGDTVTAGQFLATLKDDVARATARSGAVCRPTPKSKSCMPNWPPKSRKRNTNK